MGNISGANLSPARSLSDLGNLSKDFGKFTFKPEDNWVKSDKNTVVVLNVPQDQRAEMLPEVKKHCSTQDVERFEKTGKLPVYMTAESALELDHLKKQGDWQINVKVGNSKSFPY